MEKRFYYKTKDEKEWLSVKKPITDRQDLIEITKEEFEKYENS